MKTGNKADHGGADEAKVAALILAAGASRRMGSPKQLLAFGETTLLDLALDAVASPEIETRVVVLGAHADAIRAQIRRDECEMVHNAHWQAGMLGSVQAGLTALADSCSWVLIFPCDYGLVQPSTIDRLLLRAVRSREAEVVVPTLMGRGGHPFLLHRGLFAGVLGLSKTDRLDAFLKREGVRREMVEVMDPAIHFDIDTPADYERGLAAWNARLQASAEASRVLMGHDEGEPGSFNSAGLM